MVKWPGTSGTIFIRAIVIPTANPNHASARSFADRVIVIAPGRRDRARQRGASGGPTDCAGDGADLGDGHEDGVAQQHTCAGGDANTENGGRRSAVTLVDSANAGVDHAPASQGKDQATGGDEVSVEALEQREQSGGEDDLHDPARAHGLLEGDGRHEFFAGEQTPGSYIGDGGNDAGVESNADKYRHPDGAKEALRAEFGAGLFGGLAHRFEASHEIGDNLDHQQNRDQRECE